MQFHQKETFQTTTYLQPCLPIHVLRSIVHLPPTPIHGEHLPWDPCRILRAKERNSVCDIIGMTGPPHESPVGNVLLPFLSSVFIQASFIQRQLVFSGVFLSTNKCINQGNFCICFHCLYGKLQTICNMTECGPAVEVSKLPIVSWWMDSTG